MKLKQRAEDFQVEEITAVVPGAGPHALYRLEKRGWSTPDALAAIRRRWKIALRRLSTGGLKDRHAQTVQYFTIFHGPSRNLTHQQIRVTYLGQVAEAYTSRAIQANSFRITLRDLADTDAPAIMAAIEAVRRDGVPNYFDDQRFGSVTMSEPPGLARRPEFVGRLLVRGQFEDALRQALTAPYEHDRAGAKREKAVLRQHWGDWATLQARLPNGPARAVVAYLVHHPGDFRGAVAQLRPDLRGLYLSAYQSALWNRMLARWLEQHCARDQRLRVRLRLGEVPFHQDLDPQQHAELAALQLPLPSARMKLPADDPRLPLVQGVLAEEGLELQAMQVKGVREMFFSKGERAALCQPAKLHCEMAPDELHPGRQKATLSFELPRGAYATLIVKRVSQQLPGS
jgi:tRNA pseudouridine13 synthase